MTDGKKWVTQRTIAFDDDLWEKIEEVAKAAEQTRSGYIRAAVKEKIERESVHPAQPVA